MIELTPEQKDFYDNVVEFTKGELEEIASAIERELADVKDRITQLNGDKQAARQVYDGACARLGVPNVFDEEDEGEEEIEE